MQGVITIEHRTGVLDFKTLQIVHKVVGDLTNNYLCNGQEVKYAVTSRANDRLNEDLVISIPADYFPVQPARGLAGLIAGKIADTLDMLVVEEEFTIYVQILSETNPGQGQATLLPDGRVAEDPTDR